MVFFIVILMFLKEVSYNHNQGCIFYKKYKCKNSNIVTYNNNNYSFLV